VERESPLSLATDPALAPYTPTVAWAVERDGLHTRLNLVPAAFTRNRRGPFQVHLTLVTEHEPDGVEWMSPRAVFDRDLRIGLADAFPPGPDGYEGYVRVIATSPNQDLRPQHYNEVWLDDYSDDGRVHGVLPTVQFYGSVKRTLGGQHQVWPGLVADATFRPSLIAINPYQEEVLVRLRVQTPDGVPIDGDALSVPAHRQRRWRLPDVLPGLVPALAPHRGIGTLLVTASHKLICYFMIENVVTGTITGMDHLAYFYGETF
jgi:hypothetical protein